MMTTTSTDKQTAKRVSLKTADLFRFKMAWLQSQGMQLMLQGRAQDQLSALLETLPYIVPKRMERNYFIKNKVKLCSDSNGAPSADEVTAASLVMMYADHPGDVTVTSRQFRANYHEN